jgi:thiol-disulfide isomerase/thioredoxin
VKELILFLLCLASQLCAFADDSKPSIVLVTQRLCIPCRPAKALIEKLEREQVFAAFNVIELDLVKDKAKLEKYGFAVSLTPTVFVANQQNEVTTAITTIDENNLRTIAEMVPVECINPMKLVFDEPIPLMEVGAPGDTVITWDLATQYRQGSYNGTFAFGDCERALNAIGRWKKLTFKRVTRGGQVHIVQGNYQHKNDPNIAGWTSGNTITISPTFRFVNEVQCGMVSVHEWMHTSGVNRNSGGHHAQDGGIMGPNGGYLVLPSDYPWIARYAWRSTARPTDEPNWFRSYLSRNAVLGADDASQFPLLQGHK